MSITEYERHQVFRWCEEAMGPERAAIMMQLLPPVGWGDIATRADLHALGTELRGEMAEQRGEMAELRGEMAELRAEVRTIAADGLRTLVLASVASNVTIAGLVLAAVRLG